MVFLYFFNLFDKVKRVLKRCWLSINMFNFRNFFIFCRRGNLSIGNTLRICVGIMPTLLYWKKSDRLSSQKEEFNIKKQCCETKVFYIFRALSFSGSSKSFKNCGYGWRTVVWLQSGSLCAESVEIGHLCGILRDPSELFLLKNSYCLKGSKFRAEQIVYAVYKL